MLKTPNNRQSIALLALSKSIIAAILWTLCSRIQFHFHRTFKCSLLLQNYNILSLYDVILLILYIILNLLKVYIFDNVNNTKHCSIIFNHYGNCQSSKVNQSLSRIITWTASCVTCHCHLIYTTACGTVVLWIWI